MIFKSICCLLAALSIAVAAPDALARSQRNAADPKWNIHSAFYNQPRRVCVTQARTYFLVHSVPFSTQDYSRYYNHASGSIFFIDNQNPGAGMQDLAHKVHLSGFNMTIMDADPVSGHLAVAYEDGGIDLISPDGTLSHFDILKEAHNYMMAAVTALSFEPGANKLFVCTKGGFICIDTAKAAVSMTADWSIPVSDIVRLDNRYIAIINNSISESLPGADISLRNSFSELRGIASGTPLRLLPFSNGALAFINHQGDVYACKKSASGSWSRSALFNDRNIVKEEKVTVANRLEHNVFPTSDGFAVTSPSCIYLISPDEGDSPAKYVKVTAPSGVSAFSGTANGADFWFFLKSGEVARNSLSGNAWAGFSQSLKAPAPHIAKDVYFRYSPTRGFLAISKTPGQRGNVMDQIVPLYIDAFRDGVWSDISPRSAMPYFVEGDPSLENYWTKNLTYPQGASYGMVIDPLNPDVLIAGYLWNGVAAVYLDDPRKTPHVHSVANAPFVSAMDAIPMFPASTWVPYAGLYILGADADNNIWATRSNLRPVDGSSQNVMQLWVLTPEARREAFENDEPAACGQWKRMEVDGGAFTEFYVMGTALRHPKNKNKFLLNGQVKNGKGRPLRVYNTNGTFDDSSDDTLTDINYFRRDDGGKYSATNIFSYFEDPATGDIFVSAGDEIFIIDLDSPVTGNTIDARSISLRTEDGNLFTPFSGTQAYDMIQDEYGRLWIATSKLGVFGISPDRSSLVAHFCAEDSPLPENDTYGVGWNPETQSLFISTRTTIAEVKVDAPEETFPTANSTTPFIVPASVTPEYAGTVAIHNVPPATSLRVRNAQGKTVAVLSEVVNGVTFWNLLDSDGNLVPAGKYTIIDASGSPTFEPIIIPVIR